MKKKVFFTMEQNHTLHATPYTPKKYQYFRQNQFDTKSFNCSYCLNLDWFDERIFCFFNWERYLEFESGTLIFQEFSSNNWERYQRYLAVPVLQNYLYIFFFTLKRFILGYRRYRSVPQTHFLVLLKVKRWFSERYLAVPCGTFSIEWTKIFIITY